MVVVVVESGSTGIGMVEGNAAVKIGFGNAVFDATGVGDAVVGGADADTAVVAETTVGVFVASDRRVGTVVMSDGGGGESVAGMVRTDGVVSSEMVVENAMSGQGVGSVGLKLRVRGN
jgi:hypothetical protein